MTSWHVAVEALRDRIEKEGLDPAGSRAILLLPKMPESADGLDIWEVDIDAGCPDGSASFLTERIAPGKMRLARASFYPGM